MKRRPATLSTGSSKCGCSMDGRCRATDLRRWNYLLACGIQLQAWNLDRLAGHLWRHALAEASAFDRENPEVRNILGEIRLHQLLAEVVTAADPQEARERVTEYLRETPSVIMMAAAATVLTSAGQHVAAVQIYQRLHREVPTVPEYQRGLLLAEEGSGDSPAVEETLRKMLLDPAPAGVAVNRSEAVTKLTSMLESSGDVEQAYRVLLEARRTSPPDLLVLPTLARLLERHQRFEDAAAIWREAVTYDRGPTSLEALASVEYQRGRRDLAFELARDAKTPDAESDQSWWFGRRVELYIATGHAPEAVELAWQWVRDGKTDGLTVAGSDLAMRGQRPAARELFAAAVRLARDPLVRFQMQQALIQFVYVEKDTPMSDFVREMQRLERLADTAPGQSWKYAYDRYTFAIARGATEWLENELKGEWKDGQGDVGAGERLADLYFETKRWDPLQRLVAAFDARPNLPEQLLYSLETRLVKTGHAAWALPISDRLCRRFPLNADYIATRARALWQSGQRDEAIRVLDALDAAGVFRDDFAGRAALVYLEMGDRAHAISSLERTVALDPLAVRSAPLYCRLAALYLDDKRPDDAYALLAVAYRHPSQTDMEPLVNYLEGAGRLKIDAVCELPGGDLPLTFRRRAQLLSALYDRLQRSGHSGEAFRLAIAHPELLSAVPALATRLRTNAMPEQLPAVTRLVEDAIRQADGPAKPLENELAKLYVRRAELAAASQPPQSDEALAFLKRADELEPADFSVARPLAVALQEQHRPADASTVLAPFLGAVALPTERASARQVLGMK